MWIKADLSVQGASAKNAYCVYGHPSPLAFIGFAHALCARSGLQQTSGTLAALRRYRSRSTKIYGRDHFMMLRSADRDIKPSPDAKPGTQTDIPRADLDVSVVFKVDPHPGFDASVLDTVLPTMRFAGGVLVEHTVSVHDDSAAAFTGLGGSYVMRAEALPPSDDALESLLEVITVKRKRVGWITPSLRGLRLLEAPQVKTGARGGHPHAYADPLIGVVRFESARNATEDDLWRMERHDNLIFFKTDSE